MPYVCIQTNLGVSKNKEALLAEKIGPAIELIPNKTRENLFVKIEGDAALYFGGSTDIPCAMVTVDLFGKSDTAPLSQYTKTVCEILDSELSIPKENVYISYTVCNQWGSNGNTNAAQ